MSKKNVCIIYTGGTIGMTKTKNGYAPQRGYLPFLLSQMPELQSSQIPDYILIELNPLLDSSNISVKEWNLIGKTILQNYDQFDGFVILHGTDTMAYTASALSFMLENLKKPVIITGSQIPFCEIRNDAKDNLITALLIAAEGTIPEVCLYFSQKLFRGNRSTKMSADELIAFDSPNYPALAQAGIRITIDKNNILKQTDEPFSLQLLTEYRIAVLKIFPGLQFGIFEDLVSADLKGIVLEAFGAGNIPNYDQAFLRTLENAAKNETIIAVCTQCFKGSARIGDYESSLPLQKNGVVSAYDMTVEATVTKLYYLISKGYSKIEIEAKMQENLRGELTI
ncbi:asparaginase [Sinanaerobacter sp. ZZT-01]|uniref:asparaginase n=1 Tax=Sinanaerobacter sp. ZZT-01 TaxID=3111540 RepID=UPI002D774214|nr:asparaginase [Sinanaerobacter sp. ZZT-01]WRR94117.1 asparaginase [Sinanaerobacter sp. ZZT-01]